MTRRLLDVKIAIYERYEMRAITGKQLSDMAPRRVELIATSPGNDAMKPSLLSLVYLCDCLLLDHIKPIVNVTRCHQ